MDFKQAINAAKKSITDVVTDAKNIKLEEVMISSDNKLYEVTLSYESDETEDISEILGAKINANMKALASLMSRRRQHKVILIDSSNFSFRGFRNKEI